MNNSSFYELSNPQKSIWLTEQYYSNTNISTIMGIMNFTQEMNIPLLSQAINLMVKQNDATRIKIKFENGITSQYVEEYQPFVVDVKDTDAPDAFISDFNNIAFDILNSRLFNFTILKTPKDVKLILKFHHIISDAWSLSGMAKQIIQIYEDLTMGNDIPLDNCYSYLSYISTEKEYLTSSKCEKDRNYWEEIYKSEPQLLTLQSGNQMKVPTAYRLSFKLDFDFCRKIEEYCKTYGISPYCFFLTCFQLYISKNYNVEDVIIGNPFLNRKNHFEKNSVGMYINTLPVRLKTNYDLTVNELFEINKNVVRNTLKHQQYSYNDILKYVKDTHSINQNLYQVLFSFQNAQSISDDLKTQYNTGWVFNKNISDCLELHIHDRDNENIFNLVFDYQVSVFDKDMINSMYNKYVNIITQIISNENVGLKEIEIISNEEKNELLSVYSGPNIDISDELSFKNVFNYISHIAKDNLNKIALEDINSKLTYGELIKRVNQLAYDLKTNHNIIEHTNIGILTSKNIDTIIGILAILKLNCTVVPIDVEYPEDRKNYMIENAHIDTVLYLDTIPDISVNYKIDISYLNYANSPEDAATYNYNENSNLYIVYTSGSTGNPKPVTLSHKNMINLIMHEIKTNELSFTDAKILQFATLSFDVSYQEIFTALFTSSTLVMISDEDKKDTLKLTNYIISKNITILFIPPRYLVYLADTDRITDLVLNLKHIITAGEQLIITDSIKQLLDCGILIHNHYGPAETHVVTSYVVNKDNFVTKPPLGRPIANSFVYILDKNLNLCTQNVVGELYLSGLPVGNGYYEKDDLTAQRFLPDPFNPNCIMYKTGDLAKIDNSNNIYYLGRSDFQVKINGFRIEIEEVEKQIANISDVKNIAILVEKNELEKSSLVAYLELSSKIDYRDFKNMLLNKLPKYMIPSKFLLVPSMPLNINGKVDKRILVDNKESYTLFKSLSKNVKPANDTEKVMLKCMKNVLNQDDLTVESDFFEVGGDSLLAIAFQIQLSKSNILLNTQEIYDHSSVRSLYTYLNTKDQAKSVDSQYEAAGLISKPVYIKTGNNVLLTGATGFLGIHILHELLSNPSNTVYCIVRNQNGVNGAARLVQKYNYYYGLDISDLIEKSLFILNR